MLWDNLYVAGFGNYVPETVETAEQAIADGRFSAGEKAISGIRQVRVADRQTEAPPVMAVSAARQAVERSAIAPDRFTLLAYAAVGYQGHEFWNPPSYVQHNTLGEASKATAMEIRQSSNGGLAAFELAASWVVARPGTAALVASGDSFHLPYFNRWRSDDQQVFGDGAGAAVLTTGGGFARVMATASTADSSLEHLFRLPEWSVVPWEDRETLDLGARKRAYFETDENMYEDTIARMGKNLATVVDDVFEGTGLGLHDVQWLVHANTGATIAEYAFQRTLGFDVSQTPYEWGRDFRHMGAADHLVNMEHIFAAKAKAGDKVLTIGVGTGFTWTAVLIEVLDTPAW